MMLQRWSYGLDFSYSDHPSLSSSLISLYIIIANCHCLSRYPPRCPRWLSTKDLVSEALRLIQLPNEVKRDNNQRTRPDLIIEPNPLNELAIQPEDGQSTEKRSLISLRSYIRWEWWENQRWKNQRWKDIQHTKVTYWRIDENSHHWPWSLSAESKPIK